MKNVIVVIIAIKITINIITNMTKMKIAVIYHTKINMEKIANITPRIMKVAIATMTLAAVGVSIVRA